MDGALLVGIWFASALLVFAVALLRNRTKFPNWLLAAGVLLGPAGVVALLAWGRGPRARETPSR